MASAINEPSTQQGFLYHSMQDLSPQSIAEHRQPMRWLHDSGEMSTHTAVLRSSSDTPLADLRDVMRRLQFKSICLLVLDKEESNCALYVHCMSPINDVLERSSLARLIVHRQHVLFFMLRPGVMTHGQVQEALNLWMVHRPGLVNAAVVHSPSDMLVVFSTETIVEPIPECFQVALAFWGNVCPLLDAPSSETGSIWLSGNWASIQELNAVTRALVSIQEPGIVRIEVDEGWSQIRIRLRSIEDAQRVRDVAAKTLRSMGRRCAIKCNKIVLYQCAIPLGPFEAVIDLSKAGKSASALMPYVTATESALSAHKKDLVGNDFAYDVVMHLMSQLKCEAIIRHNYRYSFDIQGMKCTECVQLILEELFLDRPGRVGYTHIALSPARNVLAVQVPAEQRHAVEQHVQESLYAIGMTATLIGEGPDLDPVDDMQALNLYSMLSKQKRSGHVGAVAGTIGIRLRANSIRCSSCALLLRSTILRLLPGVVHIALDCNAATMVVSFAAGDTEHELLRLLYDMGYQPTPFYAPPAMASSQQSIVPVSPISPSTPPYYSCGAQPMANGQLNPYALSRQYSSQPATPTSNPGYTYARSETSNSSYGRAYPEPPHVLPLKKHVPVVPWKAAPALEKMALDPQTCGTTEEGNTVLVFNHDTTGELSISVPMRLRHRYTVWYDNVRTRVQLQQSGEADYTLTEVASFDAMPEFWQIWEHLNIEALEEGSILIVFRSDIPPDHNHVANRCGGRWFVRGVSTEPRIKLWTKLVLAMLSDTLTANSDHEVCGVVLSVKPSGDRIEIWVDGGYHHHGDEQPAHDKESGQYLPNVLTNLLGDELGHRRFHFWTHAGFERHRKSHRGSVRRAKRHSKLGEGPMLEEVLM